MPLHLARNPPTHFWNMATEGGAGTLCGLMHMVEVSHLSLADKWTLPQCIGFGGKKFKWRDSPFYLHSPHPAWLGGISVFPGPSRCPVQLIALALSCLHRMHDTVTLGHTECIPDRSYSLALRALHRCAGSKFVSSLEHQGLADGDPCMTGCNDVAVHPSPRSGMKLWWGNGVASPTSAHYRERERETERQRETDRPGAGDTETHFHSSLGLQKDR